MFIIFHANFVLDPNNFLSNRQMFNIYCSQFIEANQNKNITWSIMGNRNKQLTKKQDTEIEEQAVKHD